MNFSKFEILPAGTFRSAMCFSV